MEKIRFHRVIIDQINDDFPLASKDLSIALGVNQSRIRQIAPELAKVGLAVKLGSTWRFKTSSIPWIKSAPDGRGRPKKAK